jgi:hypothetical protein
MKIQKQIKKLFSLNTIPVYVPGIDVTIGEDEIVYTAIKKRKEIVDNPNWDFDSVSKPQFKEILTVRNLEFIIRDGKVMVTKAYRHD